MSFWNQGEIKLIELENGKYAVRTGFFKHKYKYASCEIPATADIFWCRKDDYTFRYAQFEDIADARRVLKRLTYEDKVVE